MTAVAKKTKSGTRGKNKLPLPASTEKAVIGGTEYFIIPSVDFENWYADQMLAAIAADRLKTEREQAAPWVEVVDRLQKCKGNKTKGK